MVRFKQEKILEKNVSAECELIIWKFKSQSMVSGDIITYCNEKI